MRESEEYTAAPSIEQEWAIHSAEFPFCNDMMCHCHEDSTLIVPIGEDVTNGLLTPKEADQIYRGNTI